MMDAPVVISQRETLSAGQKLFFTGVACKRGHLSPRYAMGGQCVECNRDRCWQKQSGESPHSHGFGKDIEEPTMWENDGGARREPVIDHNFSPPRVVRRVGWRACMCCRDSFFSPDVARVRICEPCKDKTKGFVDVGHQLTAVAPR